MRVLALATATALLAGCGSGGGSDAGEPEATTAPPPRPAAQAQTPARTGKRIRSSVRTGGLRISNGKPPGYGSIADYASLKFGKEATAAEREQAARALHGFLVARVRYDWPAACDHLSKSGLEEVRALGSHFKELDGRECPVIIDGLLGAVPARETASSSEVDTWSFRVEGDLGYLFYEAGGDPYRASMSHEEEGWKPDSIFPGRVSPPPTK